MRDGTFFETSPIVLCRKKKLIAAFVFEQEGNLLGTSVPQDVVQRGFRHGIAGSGLFRRHCLFSHLRKASV